VEVKKPGREARKKTNKLPRDQGKKARIFKTNSFYIARRVQRKKGKRGNRESKVYRDPEHLTKLIELSASVGKD